MLEHVLNFRIIAALSLYIFSHLRFPVDCSMWVFMWKKRVERFNFFPSSLVVKKEFQQELLLLSEDIVNTGWNGFFSFFFVGVMRLALRLLANR